MGSIICITGGAGFIGSHVADALVAEGHRVIILDDLSSGTIIVSNKINLSAKKRWISGKRIKGKRIKGKGVAG